MIVSRNPLGLSVLAEQVEGIPMDFHRDGQRVNAMFMQPHTGFGEENWWEPEDAKVLPWWSVPARVSGVTRPAMLVRHDGTVGRTGMTPLIARVGAKTRVCLEGRVHANGYSAIHVPIAHKYPTAFPESTVGTLLIAAARLDPEGGRAHIAYSASSNVTEIVHGDVVLCPNTEDFGLVERRIEIASAWAAECSSHTSIPRAALAINTEVYPSQWHALERTVDALLREHVQGVVVPGPIWDAVLAGFMSAILEDGIHTPEDLYSRYRDYRDVMRHLTSGGNVDELMRSLIPRWMRHPVDLAAEVLTI